MFMNADTISPAQLLELIEDACTTNQDSDSPRFMEQEIDGGSVVRALRDIIERQPKNAFKDWVGKTIDETLSPAGARWSSIGKVNEIVILFADGKETVEFLERTFKLRGTSGILTGEGLAKPGELLVSTKDGKISEIIHFESE